MKNRFNFVPAVFVLLISLFTLSLSVSAVETDDVTAADLTPSSVVCLDDDISVVFFDSDVSLFAYNKTDSNGSGYFYNSSTNARLANFTYKATFNYDGNLVNCTADSYNITDVANGYKVTCTHSRSSTSAALAQANFVFNLYRISNDGTQTLSVSSTHQISCNANGKITSQ